MSEAESQPQYVCDDVRLIESHGDGKLATGDAVQALAVVAAHTGLVGLVAVPNDGQVMP